MKIDFHSHILPGIDDGAANTEESLKMLNKLYDDGVRAVALTPHFYRNHNNISRFLKKRKISFDKLSEAAARKKNIPQLLLGCECFYYPSLFEEDVLSLCLEDTNFLMLELPFEKFSDRLLISLQNSINRSGCQIIFAHIERYLEFNSLDVISEFVSDNNILCQMNCDSLANSNIFNRKKLFRLFERNMIQLVGTDAHGVQKRPPQFADAERIINKYNPDLMKKLCRCGEMVLNNDRAEEILVT
jgi:protein-tyrosine phosphatase